MSEDINYRATFIWLGLLGATMLTWSLGEQGSGGPRIAALLLLIAVVKGRAVALDFMGLRQAPLLWRRLVEGWLLAVAALIGFAYYQGLSA